MISRAAYWQDSWRNPKLAQALILDRPFAKGVALPTQLFEPLNRITFEILFRSLPHEVRARVETSENREKILEYLNSTQSFSIAVQDNIDLFVELENAVTYAMGEHGLLSGIEGIQFPIDVRVVHAAPPPGYLDRRDAVDYLHCDAWRGEPPDLVNCVLYCAVNYQSSQLELYDVEADEIHIYESYSGPEKEATKLVENKTPLQFEHKNGGMIFFDAYSPHRTKRLGDQVRVSLNFSLRRRDPYEVLDERWDRERQGWAKFWYLNRERVTTFEERRANELRAITASHREAAKPWRERAITTFFSRKKPRENYAG